MRSFVFVNINMINVFYKTFSLLFFLLSLFPSSLYAHVNNVTKAQLAIIADEQFTISIETDLLHILANQLNSQTNRQIDTQEVDDKKIIHLIESMPMNELLKLLSAAKNQLRQTTSIRLNNQLLILSSFKGPTLNKVKTLIRLPAGDQGYPITYIGKGSLSSTTGEVTVQLSEHLGDISLSIVQPRQLFIAQGEQSSAISLSDSTIKVTTINKNIATAFIYIYQGFIHIIPKGLDHILFVLALFLLTAKFSTLLWQVSAFTLAHTITLALGIFGLVNISASIVEPLIALSIAYVAIENIYVHQLKKWRILVIFVFGLLHGLGFASVLLELGLAPNQYIISLIAFNIGVEMAQITVLLIALLCLYRFQQKPWYRQRVILPLSLAIAAVGLFWFIERVI